MKINPMTVRRTEVFLRVEYFINILRDNFILTQRERNYISQNMEILRYFRYNLKNILKFNFPEFDDIYYYSLFEFSQDKYTNPIIPRSDPFYPLLKQTHKILDELCRIKEFHDNKEQINNTTRSAYVFMTDHRKVFLKDTIKLMCKNYTVKVKNNETRVKISEDLKKIINEFFLRRIEIQHHLFFKNIKNKSSNDYIKMCKYLKILKNPVNEICKISTKEIVKNETRTDLLDRFVPGCPTFENNIPEVTNVSLVNLSEEITGDVKFSMNKKNVLAVQEPIIISTYMNSHGISLNCPVSSICLFMFMIILFKKFLCL